MPAIPDGHGTDHATHDHRRGVPLPEPPVGTGEQEVPEEPSEERAERDPERERPDLAPRPLRQGVTVTLPPQCYALERERERDEREPHPMKVARCHGPP